MPTTIYLTIGQSHENKTYCHPEQYKWVAWEERLRDVEGFDVYDPIRATEIWYQM
jgi:hypothetical protein